MIKLAIQAHTDHLARELMERTNEAAPPALQRYVDGITRQGEGEWYRDVTKRTGESGKLRNRVYRTSSGTLRAKVGSDAKYARYLKAPDGGRVLDKALTSTIRETVRDGFTRELAKELK